MNELEELENGVIVHDCFEVCQKMSTKHEWPRFAGNIVSPNFEVVVDHEDVL